MSRFYRGFFGFFGLAAIVALSFGTTATASNARFDVGAYQITMEPIDYGVHYAYIVVDTVRQERMSAPSLDETARLYHSSKQPGQTWRTTADAYRHIDPGRRIVV